jgi:RNA polymerase sigma-70 factor (ECF subfamily)
MEHDIPERTDEEIAVLVQSGSAEVFSILIDRYEAKIGRYARKFISDNEDINDVLQNIFIKAYVNIKSFDAKRKFSSWLYRIAHNELVNILKKKSKKTLPLFDLDTFFPHQNNNNNISQEIDREKTRKILDKSLNNLESKYREPIILYYFEELSYKEIADIMQIPVSTVGIRIKRAKELMQSICVKNGVIYE